MSEGNNNIEGFENGKGEELVDVDRNIPNEKNDGLFSEMSDDTKFNLARTGGWISLVLGVLMFALSIAFSPYIAIVGAIFTIATIGCMFYSNSIDKSINNSPDALNAKVNLKKEENEANKKQKPSAENELEETSSIKKINNGNIKNSLESLSKTEEKTFD